MQISHSYIRNFLSRVHNAKSILAARYSILTVSECDSAIYLWIIKRIIFSIRDRRRRYASAFLSRGWMGLAGLRRRFSRPVAHHRDAARLRITSSLRRTTSWWSPFDGHRYVKRLYWSLYCFFNNVLQKLFEYCDVLRIVEYSIVEW